MRWLEFIKVRTVSTGEKSFYIRVLDMVSAYRVTPGLLKIKVYTHANIPGDLCITMIWDTDLPESGGSKLGLGLVQELKKSGMVDHSIWIERNG